MHTHKPVTPNNTMTSCDDKQFIVDWMLFISPQLEGQSDLALHPSDSTHDNGLAYRSVWSALLLAV